MVLCEIEVFEDFATNLALGGTASSSSVKLNGYPQNANDGKHNGGWYSSNACVHTQQTTSWIKVDLGEYFMITEIILTGRSMESCACASMQSANWTLEASTSSDSGYTVYAKEIDARWIPGVQEGVRLHFSGIRGRFVRLSSETEMVLCEVEIYGTGIYHDEENDCKICPYGKYQDERGQEDVKVVPKPMVQDIELTVDEESFVNFPALQCSHEWNAQTNAIYPLHMSSMPWNVDITYVDAKPKNDPNAARLRISRPGTLENAESVQSGGISYGYLNLWDENASLIMKQVVLPRFYNHL